MERALVIAEAGLNWNKSEVLLLELIEMAAQSGADFVKFQKRSPTLSTPRSQWDMMRTPPWGGDPITYIEYRKQIEMWDYQFNLIDRECRRFGIEWFSSVWDVPSVRFIMQYSVPFLKIPSAKLTDDELVIECAKIDLPLILSTGMSTLDEIDHAVDVWTETKNQIYKIAKIDTDLCLFHCNSSYPTPDNEISLTTMRSLQKRYGCRIGFSSHHKSPFPAIYSALLGADLIEAHITTDRTLPGTDHAASLEKHGLELLVREVHRIPNLMGDGTKKVWPSEEGPRKKLRG